MSTNFNYRYMAMSSLTYVLSFSVKYFFQLIYTDYTNRAYLYNRSHLIFSETAEPNKTTFGWDGPYVVSFENNVWQPTLYSRWCCY